MIHENDNLKKHGGAVGAAWIVLAVIVPVIVVGAISWVSHSGGTASNNAPQTNSSAANSR